MPDDVDVDLIRKVVEHHYFKSLLEQEVQDRTRAYLSRRWKFLTAGGSILLALTSWFGFDQYKKFKDLTALAQDRADRALEKLNQAGALLKSSEYASQQHTHAAEEYKGQAERYKSETEKWVDSSKNSALNTNALVSNLIGSLTSRQKELTDQANAMSKEYKGTTEVINRKLAEFQGKLDGIDSQAKTIRDVHDDALRVQKDIQRAEKLVKTHETVEAALLRATAWELVILRAKRAATISLPNPREPAQRYWIRLSTKGGITPPFPLDVSLSQSARGPWKEATIPNLDDRLEQCIPGSPFAVGVDFVYHTKIAHDFTVLRVRLPGDGLECPAP